MTEIPTSDVISVDIEDHVATVWLDRVEQRNAFGPAAWRDLPRIVDALGNRDDVRVVVIAARGTAFTVGIDLMAFGPALAGGTLGGDAESPAARRMALLRQIKEMQRTFSSLADSPVPVIAAVHGYCLGAGIDLITAADIRIASSDAVFSVRETRMGLVADVGTTQRLPKIINPGHVAEMVYTGRDYMAAEAKEIGLVSHVYDDVEQLHKAAAELAAAIATNSPLVVRGLKAVLRAGEGRSVEEALDYVAVWNAAFLESADLQEAIAAFVEKRPPRFTGT